MLVQPYLFFDGRCEEAIEFANFRIGDTAVMASDGRCMGQPNFQGFSLSLTAADDAEAERKFALLADRRAGATAPDQDLLLPALRHGGRPLRRVEDGTDVDA
ncbi:MAG: hypothetical protein L0219_01320 [Phycisphaerales bacterium]|nr:hypothetical protein [Phycisphaerales bacterium]